MFNPPESQSRYLVAGHLNQSLLGGWPTPLKNMTSSVGIILQNIWKNKKCSKPPTSLWNERTIWCNCYCQQYHTSNNYNDTKYKRSGDFSRSVSFFWMFNELNCHGYCWNLMIHDAKKKPPAVPNLTKYVLLLPWWILDTCRQKIAG